MSESTQHDLENKPPDWTIYVPIQALESAQIAKDDDLLRETVASFCDDPSFTWEQVQNIRIIQKTLEALVIFECHT